MLDLILPLVAAIVFVGIAMTHLSWRQGAVCLSITSLILCLLISTTMLPINNHKCDQGAAPGYLTTVSMVLAAIIPWFRKIGLWYRRGMVVSVIFAGMASVMTLVGSYHGDKITGNPLYSNGRFWHTPLTGQYPRSIAPGDIKRYKLKNHLPDEARHAETNAGGQDGGGQPESRAASE